MLFPSNVFLFVFLPIVIGVYYGLLRKHLTAKNLFLLAASLFFYAWGEPKYVFLMIATIILNYLFGLAVDYFKEKKNIAKLFLIAMVLTNVGILGWFKYSGFVVSQVDRFLNLNIPVPVVALPIGISFFTFQAMSYVIDVYRGDGKVQKNIFYVGLYISLFPQLIAGPIVRYDTVAEQIDHRVENWKDFSEGVTRFCIGLIKKTMIANNVAVIADLSFDLIVDGVYRSTTCMAWLGLFSYLLQIFFDFSGYSDMAIGLGKMFGFHFRENFNYPYISGSMTELWRRWHMSLQSWFRDYVYIPLGGSRVSSVKLLRNIVVIWVLTGIWHGANWTYIGWGLLNLVFILFEKYTGIFKKKRWWGHIYAVLVFMMGLVIFRSVNTGNAIVYYKALIGVNAGGFYDDAVPAYIRQNWLYLLMGIFASVPIGPKLEEKFGNTKIWQLVYGATVLVLTVLSVSYIMNNAYNPFIYFNF